MLVVSVRRPTIGRTLWEFPRGAADAGDEDLIATARRELAEETGLTAVRLTDCGLIHPDSGLLGDDVAVVLAEVDPGDVGRVTDGEIDDLRWLEVVEVRELIADGSIRDGISLAALVVACPMMPLRH